MKRAAALLLTLALTCSLHAGDLAKRPGLKVTDTSLSKTPVTGTAVTRPVRRLGNTYDLASPVKIIDVADRQQTYGTWSELLRRNRATFR